MSSRARTARSLIGALAGGAVLMAAILLGANLWERGRLAKDEIKPGTLAVSLDKESVIVGTSSGVSPSGFLKYETIDIGLAQPILEHADFRLSITFLTDRVLYGPSRRGALFGIGDLSPAALTVCDTQSTVRKDAVEACTPIGAQGAKSASIAWTLHPKEAHLYTAYIDLRQSFGDTPGTKVSERIVNEPDRVVFRYEGKTIPVTRETSRAETDGISFDHQTMTLAIPLEVRSTIGLTRSQYEWAKIVVGALTFLIGSGALLKILEWRAKSPRSPEGSAQEPQA